MSPATPSTSGHARDDEDDPIARRVYAQTWDPTFSVDKLGTLVAEMTQRPQALSAAEFSLKVDELLHRLGRVDISAQAAAMESDAALSDRSELREKAAEYKRLASEARQEIAKLRQVLVDEQLARERRFEYNALAKVILREPSREASEKIIAEERARIEQLKQQSREIESNKTMARKEFELLLQCVSDLEVYATTEVVDGQLSNGARVREDVSAATDVGNVRKEDASKDVTMTDD